MAKKAAGKDNGSATPGDIRDLIPSLTLHPGENPEHYAALEKALITEFTPASAMEMSLVKRLIANE